MLEEMMGISLDSMLDKWHRISKGITYSRMVGFKLLRMQNGTGNIVVSRTEGTGKGIKPGDLDEIEEVKANCNLMANLQHASTSGTQLGKAPVYDTDGSAEVQLNDNC
nr:hypothetical protein [Tanacetum cinerariifolium]